jgi:hypothetical protein
MGAALSGRAGGGRAREHRACHTGPGQLGASVKVLARFIGSGCGAPREAAQTTPVNARQRCSPRVKVGSTLGGQRRRAPLAHAGACQQVQHGAHVRRVALEAQREQRRQPDLRRVPNTHAWRSIHISRFRAARVAGLVAVPAPGGEAAHLCGDTRRAARGGRGPYTLPRQPGYAGKREGGRPCDILACHVPCVCVMTSRHAGQANRTPCRRPGRWRIATAG